MLTFPWYGMDPYENFALEYYLATEALPDEPLVFLWRTRPGLMIGNYQNSYQEVKQEVLKAHELFLVRRKSGGGTIYTDPGTIQYSVIDPHPPSDADFEFYMAFILEGLKAMGYPVQIKGRNDLEMDGRKCSGHAQYRRGSVLVHHGSLLVQADLDMMIAASSPDPMKIASKGIASIRERVVNIDPQIKSVESFMKDLSRSLVPNARPYDLQGIDWKRVEELAQQEFAGWETIYGANPAFSWEKSTRFPGGGLSIALNVKKGRIEDITIEGDFFAGPDFDALCPALLGVDLRREALTLSLDRAGVNEAFRDISIEDFLDLISP